MTTLAPLDQKQQIPVRKRRGLGFWRRIILAFSLLFLLTTAVPAPQPAHAFFDPADIAMEIFGWLKRLWDTISGSAIWTSLNTLWTTFSNFFLDSSAESGANDGKKTRLWLAGDQLKNLIIKKLNQDGLDKHVASVMMGTQAKVEQDTNTGLASDQTACNIFVGREGKGLLYMMDFTDFVTEFLRIGIDATYRGPEGGGNSMIYVTDMDNIRCGLYETNPIKTGNVLDNLPDECLAPITIDGIGTKDMDLDPDSITGDYAYEMPPIKKKEIEIDGEKVEVSVLFPETYSQQLWMKAASYCYIMAGPRPDIGYGDELMTHKGGKNYVMFKSAGTPRNEFVSQCTRRLAERTRPNCSMTGMDGLCQAAEAKCAAAREVGADLDPSFGNCTNGLSYAEFLELESIICSASARFQAEAIGGANLGEISKTPANCNKIASRLKTLRSLEKQGLSYATQGIIDIQPLYAGVSR